MDEKAKKQHPALARRSHFNADGSIRPFSLSEQWKQVEDWHSFLETDASKYPVLDSLAEAWDALEPLYELNGKCCIERGAALIKAADSPLVALFYFIELGFYPPPELLLTIRDCWATYSPDNSLEDVFFGPTKKGIGNRAARDNSKFLRMFMRADFRRFVHEGRTRLEAAETLSEKMGGKPDAESILRMFRGVATSGHKQAEK